MRSTSASSSPVLDVTVLEELSAIDEGIVADLVHAFTSDVPLRLAALRSSVSAASGNDILREAHGLKGGACAVGATRMAEVCALIEDDARAGRFADATLRAGRLQAEFEAVRVALDSLISAYTPPTPH
jgi:HPt (histidine-containing phosphotransfer) domain-containing protein